MCRAVGVGLSGISLALYPGKGDACSDDPSRKREECKTDDDRDRCKLIKRKCINLCYHLLGKGDGQPYLKCIADCMIENGCSVNNPDFKT